MVINSTVYMPGYNASGELNIIVLLQTESVPLCEWGVAFGTSFVVF